ncbi:hypothetical protein ABID47_005634 [Paenibacillus favisporus]|uniref:BIG2 domain-containing protein n=1 Tax=Paenibacillus favisporus TaxID=221028 RepID=A0ABV2FB61_9BACL
MTTALRKPAMMLMALVTGICLWGSQTATSYAGMSSSQLEAEWTQLYGDPANYNTPDHVAPTADGGFVMLSDLTSRTFGPTSLHVIKTDASGGTEWETDFFDEHYVTEAYHGYDIQQTRDGGYIIGAGLDDRSDGGPLYRAYLLKLSSTGQVEWSRAYSTVFENPVNSVQETSDGGFIVTSSTYNRSDTAPAYVFETDKDGNLRWDHTFRYSGGGPIDFRDGQVFNAAAETSDGGFWVVGRYYDSSTYYPLLVKYNASGKLISKRMKETSDWGRLDYKQIMPSADGKGYIMLNAEGLWEIDRSGNTLWNLRLTDSSRELDDISFLQMNRVDDGYLVFGKDQTSDDHVILKLNAEGKTVDVLRQEIPGYTGNFNHAALLQDGGFVYLNSIESSAYLQLTKFKLVSQGEQPGEGEFFLDDSEYSVTVNDMIDIVALLKKPDGTVLPVTKETRFSIENPEIASIDEEGNIIGLAPGLTSIKAEYNGQTAAASLLVVKPYVPKPVNSISEETGPAESDSTDPGSVPGSTDPEPSNPDPAVSGDTASGSSDSDTSNPGSADPDSSEPSKPDPAGAESGTSQP